MKIREFIYYTFLKQKFKHPYNQKLKVSIFYQNNDLKPKKIQSLP